jgi:hypothetical protein
MWEDMKTLKDALEALSPKSGLIAVDTAKQGALF